MTEQNSGQFDLVVIGGGPGGYVAAIKAAQLGLNTACIESRGSLGGTCLNVGCIPSKALLKSSELYAHAAHDFEDHGIGTGKLSLDLGKMLARKDKVVTDLTKGIEGLFKKNGVTYLKGHGSFQDANTVLVDGANPVSAKNFIIATGSSVATLPGMDITEKRVVSSTGALDLPKVPKKLIVIGGGVIGLELGSVWARLGAEVEVIEFADKILATEDIDVSKQFLRILKKQGLTFQLSSKVTSVEETKTKAKVTYEPVAGGDAVTSEADYVLVAVGRKPNTEGLNLEAAGVAMEERGRIAVNDHLQTSVPHIYAIGDVVRGAMLAHKAEEEGVLVAEQLVGQKPHINYDAIPGIVYTAPEVASVGAREQDLKAAGVKYKTGSFPLTANSRARATGETEGFVKLIADAETDKLLGGHIVAPTAGDLIHELVTIMEFGGSAEDIARSSHGHPTVAEAIKEAALAIQDKPIHM